MNPLISLIIPVYNPGTYFDKCIESIINQTYRNLEIILVDDGSSDGSAEVCDKYAQIDHRIVAVHQENKGVSEARNVGLKICKGEFVAFVDSDDFVELEFVAELYESIIKFNTDLAICGLEKIGGINVLNGEANDNFSNEVILLNQTGVISEELLWFHSICSNQIGSYLWNKLFRKELIADEKLDAKLTIGEDLVFLTKYLINSKNAYYIAKPLYKYRMNSQSALNCIDGNREKTRIKIRSSLESVDLLENITCGNVSGTISDYVSYRKIRSSIWCLYRMILAEFWNDEISKKVKQNIRNNIRAYRQVNLGSQIQNLAVNIAWISPKIIYYIGICFKQLFPKKMYKLSRQ